MDGETEEVSAIDFSTADSAAEPMNLAMTRLADIPIDLLELSLHKLSREKELVEMRVKVVEANANGGAERASYSESHTIPRRVKRIENICNLRDMKKQLARMVIDLERPMENGGIEEVWLKRFAIPGLEERIEDFKGALNEWRDFSRRIVKVKVKVNW
jgi:hypothetical protein